MSYTCCNSKDTASSDSNSCSNWRMWGSVCSRDYIVYSIEQMPATNYLNKLNM